MRYRALDANGDYSFGQQQANFLIDSPEAVAQAILTRLRMLLGSWWLDTSDGTPWATDILGKGTDGTRDAALQARVLGTDGVLSIENYTSGITADRRFNVSMTVNTIYGQVEVEDVL